MLQTLSFHHLKLPNQYYKLIHETYQLKSFIDNPPLIVFDYFLRALDDRIEVIFVGVILAIKGLGFK